MRSAAPKDRDLAAKVVDGHHPAITASLPLAVPASKRGDAFNQAGLKATSQAQHSAGLGPSESQCLTLKQVRPYLCCGGMALTQLAKVMTVIMVVGIVLLGFGYTGAQACTAVQ